MADAAPGLDKDAEWQDVQQSIAKPSSDDLRASPGEEKELVKTAVSMILGRFSGGRGRRVAALQVHEPAAACCRVSASGGPLGAAGPADDGARALSLTEVLFDIPGHYCRRIVSVSLSLPCIVDPYTSQNCTLRLLQHVYRINAEADSAAPAPTDPDPDPVPPPDPAQGPSPLASRATATRRLSAPSPSPRGSWTCCRTCARSTTAPSATSSCTCATWPSTAPQSGGGGLKLLIGGPGDFASERYAFRAALQAGRNAQLRMPGVGRLLPFWTQRLRVTVDSIAAVVFPDVSGQLDMSALAVDGLEELQWTASGHRPVGDALVLEAAAGGRDMARDWLVKLPNQGRTSVTVDAVWFVVQYSAQMRK
ncbi:Putative toxin subunit protein [Tolypocladium paradoxum]|uniref:Toxin subunit protein n=1 Tax=Tolypocladium paradoxum TaxID=94208 RepID=A0A2S4L616_9HYPO|nr:Putative toxin subunit protein [Tolypocladium paradoxum]